MHLSDKLAGLNAAAPLRQLDPGLHPPMPSRPCWPFKVTMYTGLDAEEPGRGRLATRKTTCACARLYGLLHPLDLIKPYRLEMGASWPAPRRNLIATFWEFLRISEWLNQALAEQGDVLLSLAATGSTSVQ
jgi:cytoplasmic iron level regulating protein YaaA (DUF328/UPF0246 family)